MAMAAVQLQGRPSPETPARALAFYLSVLEMPEQGISVGCTETIVHHQGQQLAVNAVLAAGRSCSSTVGLQE